MKLKIIKLIFIIIIVCLLILIINFSKSSFKNKKTSFMNKIEKYFMLNDQKEIIHKF